MPMPQKMIDRGYVELVQPDRDADDPEGRAIVRGEHKDSYLAAGFQEVPDPDPLAVSEEEEA
jgi:hypothetical protein